MKCLPTHQWVCSEREITQPASHLRELLWSSVGIAVLPRSVCVPPGNKSTDGQPADAQSKAGSNALLRTAQPENARTVLRPLLGPASRTPVAPGGSGRSVLSARAGQRGDRFVRIGGDASVRLCNPARQLGGRRVDGQEDRGPGCGALGTLVMAAPCLHPTAIRQITRANDR